MHEPLDPTCTCTMCTHNASYIHHLYKTREPVYIALASEHNITYYMRIMERYRQKIFRNEV